MKRYYKSLLSLFMSVLLVFSVCTPVLASSTSEMPDISVYTLVPDGEVSESGYQAHKIVDENGEEVVFESSTSTKKPISNKVSSIPDKYSSKDSGYCSDVKNQGGTNSCWAFSAIASAESTLLRKGLAKQGDDVADLSEAHLVWFTHKSLTTDVNDPTFGDGTNIGSPYSVGGDWHRSTYTLARGAGFALEKDYPFYPYNSSYMGNYDESKRYDSKVTLDEAFLIPEENTDEIKKAVMEYGSVSFAGLITMDNLYGVSYYQNKYVGTNHQMIIVGWDDNYSVDNFNPQCKPENPGAWLVKNSYDTTWGDKGYFWISYEEPSLTTFLVQDVSFTNEEENVYQYDGFGYYSMIGVQGYYDGKIANVFTAQKNEAVSSVAFYTAQDNVTYEISVYKNVTKGAENPIQDGEKFAVVTEGYAKYQGYHKVSLDKVVPIGEGETFSIVVKLSVPESGGQPIIIPVEGTDETTPDGINSLYYSSESGQSFFTLSDLGWSEPVLENRETGKLVNYNNVCVKAFTVPDNALEIRTAEEFNAFAEMVANGESFDGRNVNLMADIDFAGGEIIPVGTEKNPFKGYFLGNGYVIKNGVINSDSDYAGVFSVLTQNAEISKLGVEDITVGGVYGVGAVCGYNEGKIIYCYSSGSVSGEESVGGLVGINAGTISHSYSICDVTGEYDAGSFIGENDNGEVINSYVINSSLDPIYNDYSDGITPLDGKYFSNGLVAFYLDEGKATLRKNVWTKRDGKTTFLKSDDEIIYQIELYDTSDFSSVYVYANSKDSIKALAENEREGMTVEIYADSKHKVPYDSVPKGNAILYVVWSVDHVCADFLEFVPGVEATCYTDGNIPYYKCECGKLYTDENAETLTTELDVLIFAFWHPLESVIKTERVEPTHTEDGNIEYYTCSLCGDVFEEEICENEVETTVIPASGHNHSDWVTEKEPDCETDGLKVRICSCGDRIEETIPATGHTPGDEVVENNVEPDCVNNGSYDLVVYCTVCGEELSRETKVIDALGHTEGEATEENRVEPDCINDGSYDLVVYCTVCGEELSRETTVIDALGHTEGEATEENRVEPDCINNGSYDLVVYCTVCGEELSRETNVIDALGHTEGEATVENRVEPDCVNDGSYDLVVYCTVCGEELSRETNVIDALGHTSGETVVENRVQPDCINEGSYDNVVYCSVCGEELSRTTNAISAKGHIPAEAVKEKINQPDSETIGSYDEVVYCSFCNEELSRETKTIDIVKEVSISINITSYLSETDEITIEFIKYGETEPSETIVVTGNNATYNIESILSGVYTVRVSKNNHVTREYENVVIEKAGEYAFKICPIGDVNGDGKITVVDYTSVLKHVKKTSLLYGYSFSCADVNGDGKIIVVDYTKILKHVKKTEYLW